LTRGVTEITGVSSKIEQLEAQLKTLDREKNEQLARMAKKIVDERLKNMLTDLGILRSEKKPK